jgi:hypothetical protein
MCRVALCLHLEADEEAATVAFERLEVARRKYETTRALRWRNRIAICTMVLAALAPQMLRTT